jgi:hypothetical protein
VERKARGTILVIKLELWRNVGFIQSDQHTNCYTEESLRPSLPISRVHQVMNSERRCGNLTCLPKLESSSGSFAEDMWSRSRSVKCVETQRSQ